MSQTAAYIDLFIEKINDYKVIDLDDVQAAPDETAASLSSEAALIQGALLGYGKANFLEMPIKFGRWNTRKVNAADVSKLVLSMQPGIERYHTENLIPLIVNRAHVNVTELTKTPGDGGDSFPPLTISADAEIFAAGGQHRRAALMQIGDDLKATIAMKQTGLTKLQEAVAKGAGDVDACRAAEAEIMALKARLKGLGMWGFAVYDLGASSYTVMKILLETLDLDLALATNGIVAKTLSRNNVRYMRGETEDEFFVNLVRDLSDELNGADLTDKLQEQFWTKAKNKSSTYGEIFACTPIVQMLLELYQLKDYYAFTKIFQPYSLTHFVVGVHGGVRVHFSLSIISSL